MVKLKYLKAGTILLLALGSLVAFQNCAEGLPDLNQQSTSASQSVPPPPPPAIVLPFNSGTEIPMKVCFYEHDNYTGRSACASGELGNLDTVIPMGLTSIRIEGNIAVVLCDGPTQNGDCRTFSASVTNLADFNDRTASFSLSRAFKPGICFFESGGFGGKFECFQPATVAQALSPDLAGKLSSISVGGGPTVSICAGPNGGGDCRNISAAQASLVNFNDMAVWFSITP